jgi:anti-sigma regulatory factor (Ser/Thr protein kinase)
LAVPEPARLSTLDDAVLGGQGIPLIKRLSKSVSYARTGAFNRISALIVS